MNQEVERYHEAEEEMDLYDLIFIMLKNKMIIIATTVLVTLLALGTALYVRANTHDKYGINLSNNYSIDDDFFLKKTGIIPERNYVENMLKEDNVISKVFENEKLKDLYLKSVTLNTDDVATKRKFLSKKVKIITNDRDKNLPIQTGIIEFDFAGDKNLSIEIGNLLFKLYNEQYLNLIYRKIDSKYDFIYNERQKAAKDLDEMDAKIKEIMDKEFSNKYNNINPDQIISLKYPKIYSDMENIKSIYNKYNDELMGLNGFKNERDSKIILSKMSSYYVIEVESKAKLILIVGIIAGLALGIILAFVKEFIEGYQKKYS
ncbi:MAG: hypothetical protein ACRC54_01930 [Fusobacteriaceae bacterium]